MNQHHTLTPSTTGHWQARMAQLAQDAEAAMPGAEAEMLGEALDLMARAPAGLMDMIGAPARETSGARVMSAMFGVGAWESVAVAMLPADGSYLLSRGDDHIASIMLPGCDDEVTMRGNSVALALVAAMAVALSRVGAPVSHWLN